MSINFCTLAATTVNTFCGNQRAKILARLITEAGHDIVVPPAPPPPIGHGASGGIDFVPATGFNLPTTRAPLPTWRRPDEDKFQQPLESTVISVSVSDALGFSGTDTIHLDNRLDFVTVTDLEIQPFGRVPATEEVTVNISEMEM